MGALIPIVLIIVMILGGIALFKGNRQGEETLALIDTKIADFKSKTFSSQEEREIAKKQLIAELIAMKDTFGYNRGSRTYLAMSTRITDKINLL